MITDDEVIELSRAERGRSAAHANPSTSKARYRYAARKQWLMRRKAKPCADCGIEYPWFCMEFDHRDPDNKIRQQGKAKIANISDALRRLSLRVFMEEVDNCDVVCVVCHRLREFSRGEYGGGA